MEHSQHIKYPQIIRTCKAEILALNVKIVQAGDVETCATLDHVGTTGENIKIDGLSEVKHRKWTFEQIEKRQTLRVHSRPTDSQSDDKISSLQ